MTPTEGQTTAEAKPKVLIGYSACQLTREAFEAAGVEAWTCDLLPARGDSGAHIQGDIWGALQSWPWAGAVLHPMCTFLTVSAAWALKDPDFDRYPGVGYHQRVKPGTLTGAARRGERRRPRKSKTSGCCWRCRFPSRSRTRRRVSSAPRFARRIRSSTRTSSATTRAKAPVCG